MSEPNQVDALCEILINTITEYHPVSRLQLVRRAIDFAKEAHEGQLRKSGEPYFIHPLSVAIILAELGLDLESIVAGILHDVVEDTPYTLDTIRNMFGEEIAQIVDGVTKLDKMEYVSKEEEQAENFRKMLLSMSKDIRVILIKIADRLHNMRTLNHRAVKKQHDVALETLEVYAPLAHRLGIAKLRYELEDLCFRYSDPDAYFELAGQIDMRQKEREEIIEKKVRDIKAHLAAANITAAVDGRYKHFFSIYKKMKKKDKTLDEIYDLFAIRVIVEDETACYVALSVIHRMYNTVPARFKDYISMPKANGYKSLHTTVIGKQEQSGGDKNEPFEVQIRTKEMHRVAEYGVAAHWKYKENRAGQINRESEEAKYAWLREMMDWQRELSDNKEFMAALKTDMDIFKDHIYCFTPRGMVVKLISGANLIDFAYAIHSGVGDKMIGAKVNGKIVPIETTLSTGDQVEILTSPTPKGPSVEWLRLAKTSQARNKINKWLKDENRAENIQRGIDLIETEAKKYPVPLKEMMAEGRGIRLMEHFKFRDIETLYAAVGYGGLKETSVVHRLYREYETAHPITNEELLQKIVDESGESALKRKSKSGIVVAGMDDPNVRFSKCCSPLPGDSIVVYITRGRGMTLHRSDCVNIAKMPESERVRIMPAVWNVADTAAPAVYHADLIVHCDDRKDLLKEIWKVIEDMNMKTDNFNVRSVESEAVFTIGVEVASAVHLEKLCTKLGQVRSVHDVNRVNV